ncbi:alpha/beta hydrolase [Ilumatobacter nonamiensis]|uniref:alpha/beta hydrolase n=1 Tax=Ilumatobacter nonamiensis TaxID=467093 RepID=UPI00034D4AFA|nr:alpha/beta hydrolase [Ilumatobacter nonamiensis]
MSDATPIDFEQLGLSQPAPLVGAILDAIRSAPTMNRVGVEASRQAASSRTTVPEREETWETTQHRIDSAGAELDVRVHRASSEPGQPIVVYCHAGGWILGDLEHSDHLCRRLANQTGAVVVNVDYRLAPEAPFPAAFDDCVAAFRWARDHAQDIGGDPDRTALAGESSGGGLAAAAALELSRNGDEAPRFLLLLEPALDISMSTPSWRSLGDLLPPAREQMEWMWHQYAPDEATHTDPRLTPAAADSAPPAHPATLILAAEYDPLRDEAMQYAETLARSRVAVEARIEQGLPHAFCNMGGILAEGLQAFDRAAAEMNRHLRAEPVPRP